MTCCGLGDPCLPHEPDGEIGGDRQERAMRAIYRIGYDNHPGEWIAKARLFELLDAASDDEALAFFTSHGDATSREVRTRIGKAMRATAFDKQAAQLMGINVDRIISITFALGAALAGLGGVLYAIAYPSINTLLGVLPGLKAFVAAVMGGIGSIPGAFIGALIMGQAESLAAGYISTPMRDAIAFTILIIVLLVRPTGIFGEPEREKA